MKLIDTSAWIHSLRPDGDPEVTAEVRALLERGEAAWCPLVRLELWNGARGDHEKRVLQEMDRELIELEISSPVWESAYAIAKKARKSGGTFPATDILISACARHHSVEVVHADTHFDALARL